MGRAPVFNTRRGRVSASKYKNYKKQTFKFEGRIKMSIRERIASWIYPAAFVDKWELEQEADTPRCDPTLNFKIYNTSDGNAIVEFYTYDHKSDLRDSSLYVITADEDYGQALARIAMLKKLSS